MIGHATEVKNAFFLYEAKAGHFAYVGDSILGRDCNLGGRNQAGQPEDHLHPDPLPTSRAGITR